MKRERNKPLSLKRREWDLQRKNNFKNIQSKASISESSSYAIEASDAKNSTAKAEKEEPELHKKLEEFWKPKEVGQGLLEFSWENRLGSDLVL